MLIWSSTSGVYFRFRCETHLRGDVASQTLARKAFTADPLISVFRASVLPWWCATGIWDFHSTAQLAPYSSTAHRPCRLIATLTQRHSHSLTPDHQFCTTYAREGEMCILPNPSDWEDSTLIAAEPLTSGVPDIRGYDVAVRLLHDFAFIDTGLISRRPFQSTHCSYGFGCTLLEGDMARHTQLLLSDHSAKRLSDHYIYWIRHPTEKHDGRARHCPSFSLLLLAVSSSFDRPATWQPAILVFPVYSERLKASLSRQSLNPEFNHSAQLPAEDQSSGILGHG